MYKYDITKTRTHFRYIKMSSCSSKEGQSQGLCKVPQRKPCPEICSLMSQLTAKLDTLSPTTTVPLTPCDPDYGTPREGSDTALRGRKAHNQIAREIIELCQIITMNGQKKGKNMSQQIYDWNGEICSNRATGTFSEKYLYF